MYDIYRVRTQIYSDVIDIGVVVQKIIFNILAFVPYADNEFIYALTAQVFHYVPKNWASPDFDHWFWFIFCFLA